jgi:hypothetical protein
MRSRDDKEKSNANVTRITTVLYIGTRYTSEGEQGGTGILHTRSDARERDYEILAHSQHTRIGSESL